MEIEVDYNPTPNKTFFISVALNDKEAVSFDFTTKAHRVTKQILVAKKKFPADQKPTASWDVLVLKNKKFVKKYHVKWIDLKKRDWCNNEIWETEAEQKISLRLTNALLKYSRLVSDNYKNLKKISRELNDFEELLTKEIIKFLDKISKS